MKVVIRATVLICALASLVLAGAGSVNGAEQVCQTTSSVVQNADGTETIDGPHTTCATLPPTDTEVQPTVGGTLSVSGRTISVFSNGNVPAHVTMAAESVTLSETSFDLAPGETHTLTFTGHAVGYVRALYSVIPINGAEAGSAQLEIGLEPYVPPFDWTPVGIAVLLIVAFLLLLRRVKPWQWRVTRVAS